MITENSGGYDLVEPSILAVYGSKLRLAILDALAEKPMSLSDLRRKVNANAPNTSSKAKDLEELGMVERKQGAYELTPWGRAVQRRTIKTASFFSAYEKHKDFWESHITSGIPPELWDDLGDLDDAYIIGTSPTNVVQLHEAFIEALNSAKSHVHGMTPLYQEAYFQAAVSWVQNKIPAKVILTDEILKICADRAGKDIVQLCDTADTLRLFAYPKLPVAIMVSEASFTLALESTGKTASFVDMNLWSKNQKAMDWGIRLFEYYKASSKPVKLGDYL